MLTVLLNALEMILKIMVIALNEWKTQVDAMETVNHLKISVKACKWKGSLDKSDLIKVKPQNSDVAETFH